MRTARMQLCLLFAAALAVVLLLGACGESREEAKTEEKPDGQAAEEKDVGEKSTSAVMEALEGEEPEAAKKLAAECVVRIDVAGDEEEYYGSGVIWDHMDGRPIIVTAGHLLEEGEVLRIVFADGSACTGKVLGTAECADVGFVKAEWEEERPAVSLHQRIFDTLDAYSALFVIAGTQDGAGDVAMDAVLEERAWYREEFGSDVMILRCRSGPGMSGGGVFDGYGHLVGLVAGGSGDRTAALSMETLNDAYEEVCSRRRDTEAYS